jgi:undecaprenyl diphosphate synthase
MSPSSPRLSAQARAALPTHVAIIMDGNGRWAKERHLPRVKGHWNGVESVKAVVRAAGEVGIKYLTLYAFSVENWNRPQDEIDTLMSYLLRFLRSDATELIKNNVRLEVIGQIYRLPDAVQKQLRQTQALLSKNNGLTLIMALSYGGRTEIVEAIRGIAQKVRDGCIEPAEINEKIVADHLNTRQWPDPDLLIRTSGEFRLSNFMLWQVSYTELIVTPTLWPDFRRAQFYEALEEYSLRHRRFGAL